MIADMLYLGGPLSFVSRLSTAWSGCWPVSVSEGGRPPEAMERKVSAVNSQR